MEETYQLVSACCHGMPVWIAFPLMTISQRRIVLATTGMRPMEKTMVRAAVFRVSSTIVST